MAPHLITQDCKNNCGAKVDTLLRDGDTIPNPRECVRCAAKKKEMT